jgi:signal transduction histidine kinase
MAIQVLGEGRRSQKANREARSEGELSEANRHLHEFLALLGHDLRGSLAAIHGALVILGPQGVDAAAREQAQGVMERHTLIIGRLVKDLLEMSYSTHGKIPLDKQFQDLAHILAGAVEKVQSFNEVRQVEFKLPQEPVVPDTGSGRFEQTQTNLLNNAAKYAEASGRVWVTVEVQGGDVVVRIRDSGASADSEMLPRIFDPYWQVDHSFDRSQGGLSIGLALFRQLAEVQGGSASTHSVGSDRGSEFVVRLPVNEPDRQNSV